MRVADVRLRTVSVPFIEPAPWRYGVLRGISTVLVEVETDDGVVGLGEAPGVPSPEVIEAILRSIAAWLPGEDPSRVARFLRLAAERGGHHHPHTANVAVAAVEMALWDVCGKAAGLPANRFVGGLEQERVPFYWHVNAPDGRPETLQSRAAEGLEQGFGTLYLKVGFGIERDLELARAVRAAVGPDVRLRIDPNEAWRPFEATRRLAEIEELALELLEQPFDMHDHAAAAELRRRARTPVAANQSSWLPHDVGAVLRADAADAIVTGLHQIGGMAPLRDAAAQCRLAGVPLVRHSLCDLGVATAAALHVMAALAPEQQLDHQTHLTLLEHDLVAPRFVFENGTLAVPTAPGLGVALDEQAVSHYEERHRREGGFESYE